MPGDRSMDATTAVRPNEEGPVRSEGDDGDERVVELAELAITMGCDTVTPVAVVVEPDPSKRHAIVLLEGVA